MSVEPTTPFCCLVFWAPRYVLGRSVGFRLLSVSIFSFCIFLLGFSLGKALRQPVNVGWNSVTKIWNQISYGNTALPLAPDLQKPSNPTNPTNQQHIFPKGISRKVNWIVVLGFEFAYFEAAVEYFSHYVTGNPFKRKSTNLYKQHLNQQKL